MYKIKTLEEIIKIVRCSKEEGKAVGLITGCFDVVHIGHIGFFRFAKQHVDKLVVGVDNDETISLSKGKNRPINSLSWRLDFLAELASIDYIWGIKEVTSFRNENAYKIYDDLTKAIMPDCIFTNPNVDVFYLDKRRRALKYGLKLIPYDVKQKNSSTSILRKLEAEI